MSELCVIKIGGRPLADEASLKLLCSELKAAAEETPLAIVHGGGSEVSRISRVFGLEPVFIDGKRQTSPEEMDVVEMVLAGRMNTLLVRSLNIEGLDAVGLSGCDAGLLTGEALSRESRTGRIISARGKLLSDLMKTGYLPVCSSVAMDTAGGALNINADEAALELSVSVGAARLIYLSDVPGIQLKGNIASRLNKEEVEAEIAGGEISGGMIPKVRSSFEGLERGIGEIIIGGCEKTGDLKALLAGAGTHLYLQK